MPSRDDMAEDGVAGGGGEELEEGPEGYLNLGLELAPPPGAAAVPTAVGGTGRLPRGARTGGEARSSSSSSHKVS